MALSIRARLSLMMFLQYFVWGAWFVPFATYLTHNGLQDSVGNIYSAQGWAAIAAPLFVGAIADRYFAAEKVMGILHLFAGALLFLLSSIGAVAGLIVGLVLPGDAERTAMPLYLAGGVSILYGLYSFTLPNTPPKAGDGKP